MIMIKATLGELQIYTSVTQVENNRFFHVFVFEKSSCSVEFGIII